MEPVSGKKIGRNAPCPCNSGKKYKKCCGRDSVRKPVLTQADKAASFNRALQLLQSGQLNKAYELSQEILRADPNDLAALQLSSKVFLDMGQHEHAADILEKAISLRPKQVELYNQLGNIRKAQQRIDEGIAHLSKAIEINPDYAMAYINRANALGMQGKFEEAFSDYRKALALNPEFELAHKNLLFMMNFSTQHTDADIAKEHRHFAKYLEDRFTVDSAASKAVQHDKQRLRIGYVSSDFYTHSVAYFIGPVLANHNHNEFEIFAYYTNSITDKVTQRLMNGCDNWRNVAALSDQSLYDLIRKDKIDILIDLSGYTANSRIQVFARKPALIQIAWIGYPNTTGLTRMDYRFTDAVADPPGSDDLYTEQLYRMPENFSVYQPPDECPEITVPPCTDSGAITFGSFNNFSKTNQLVIGLWARLLFEIPGSRLLLKNAAFGDETIQKSVTDSFQAHDIEADRLVLLGSDPEKHTHFQRYGQVDIGLDPFPYNGTTTTCEALWMGVPVVTLAGTSHRARVGASLLTHIGHQEWIAETADEYVSIAKQLASSYENLRSIRMKLRDEMAASPLTDARTFTLNLEKAYKDIWKKHF